MRPVLALVMLALGCAAHKPTGKDPLPPTPGWETKSGRKSTRMDLARALVEAGNPDAALEVVRKMRADGESGPDIDVLQARALQAIGLTDDAASLLQDVLAKHPRFASAHDALGVLYLDQKKVDDAIASFQRAVKYEDGNANYLNNLGFALFVARRYDESIDELRLALRADGSDERVRQNLGFSLVAAGQDKAAWRVFRAAHDAADAHYDLGLGYELRGDTDKALEEYRKALVARPQHPLAVQALKRLTGESATTDAAPSPAPSAGPAGPATGVGAGPATQEVNQ